MEFKLQALSIYEYGQRKDKDGNPHQEDWIYPSLGKINNDKDRLFILCDGMGGHAAGEVASAAVCEAMSKTINGALEKGEKFSEQLLLDAIAAAYDLLDARDTSEDGQKKMGTTMTFLMLHEEGATIAHIGDSRVYHIRPKTGKKEDIVFCTRDHSLVNDLIKIGELTEEEALNHPQKNVITRAMQPNQEHRHKADIITKKNIRPGDYFYMCSDGMLEQTNDDNLCFMLANDVTDEEKRDMLIRVSKNNHDNHSAHLIHILDVQPQSEIEEDPLPVAPTVPQETEDDEDVVNPEFDESDTAEEATGVEESTNLSESEDVENEDDESTKVGLHEPSESTSAEGGAETSATFRGEQGTTHNGRGRNKLMWGIIACVAIAILAICGVLFSKFSEKKEVVSPSSVQELNESKPHGGKDKRSNVRTNSADKPTSAQQNTEQGEASTPSSVEPSNNNTSPTVNKSSNSQASQPEPTSSPQQPSNSAQSSNTQTGQSEVASKVENALKNKQNPNNGGAVQSAEEKVQSASKKSKKK